jgi:hypothetical protein
MSITLAEQYAISVQLHDAFIEEVLPDNLRLEHLEAIASTLGWLVKFRDEVIDIRTRFREVTSAAELEALERNPRVAEILETFPGATIGAVRTIPPT